LRPLQVIPAEQVPELDRHLPDHVGLQLPGALQQVGTKVGEGGLPGQIGERKLLEAGRHEGVGVGRPDPGPVGSQPAGQPGIERLDLHLEAGATRSGQGVLDHGEEVPARNQDGARLEQVEGPQALVERREQNADPVRFNDVQCHGPSRNHSTEFRLGFNH
jgi:hypothetical protein